ncbi:MAG: GTP cyclohydrolase II [Acidimicrobiia bacterium]
MAKKIVEQISNAKVPTSWGEFTCYVFKDEDIEHLVLVRGEVSKKQVLVRVHSECLTGDVFSSVKCDCGEQLSNAMKKISIEGGVLIYLRGHEGRGIGIGHKINAYSLQENGLDTVDANIALGLPVDSREYKVAAEILNSLGIEKAKLITNNPEKLKALVDYGIDVDRVSLPTIPTQENLEYLKTKKDKLGHLIEISEITNPL